MAYQRPDWTTQWTDQDGYRRLGSVLASTGKFTRYPDAPQFVPEVLRTPVYPAFVALVYKTLGQSNVAVASAQIGVFVLICLAAGLTMTAALGLAMVHALNLISVAFAVLFVGLGVDFGLQFCVRYREERYLLANTNIALVEAARKAA